MFGFSNPKVAKLIRVCCMTIFFSFWFVKKTSMVMCSHFQGLSKHISAKTLLCKLGPGRYSDLPVGYRQVHIDWFDLDKCNVCHMDEVRGLYILSC